MSLPILRIEQTKWLSKDTKVVVVEDIDMFDGEDVDTFDGEESRSKEVDTFNGKVVEKKMLKL